METDLMGIESTTSPSMRRMLMVAAVLVFTIGAALVLVPGETNALFSWTVNPPLTAAFLGAGYWAAFLLELHCSRQRQWSRARVAVPSVLTFTALTLVVTLIHIDKFHFGSEFSLFTQTITWVWLVVYLLVPVVMGYLLVAQARLPGIDSPARIPIPSVVRALLIGQATVMLPLGVALLVAPTNVAPRVWPWALSALTGRAIGAWVVGLGIIAAHAVWEGDLIRISGAMRAAAAFGVLQLVALARYAGADHPATGEPVLDWGDARIWAYTAFVLSVAVAGLWGLRAERSVDQSRPTAAPA